MSKIQIFIDNFETLTLAKLNFYTGKVSEYKTARASAIAITYGKICSWPYKKEPDSDGVYRRDPAVSTVGDLFKFIYPNPEGGEKYTIDINNIGDVNQELKDVDTGAKPLQDILSKTWNASNSVKFLNNLRKYGAQKWFDAFMSSALKYLKDEEKLTSDYKNSDQFSNYYDRFISEFRSNYGAIADVSSDWITTDDILYDAFIEAGDNYKLPPPVSATQSGTQSGTQSVTPVATQSATQSVLEIGDYKITVKDPKSDNDRKIEGSISFKTLGPQVSANSRLIGLPHPFTNPKTGTEITSFFSQESAEANGELTWKTRNLSISSYPDTYETVLADESIVNLQSMIDYYYGVELKLQYTKNPDAPTPVSASASGTQSGTQSTPLTATQSGMTQSTFDATGIKIKLQKKSGPGEIIGEVEQIVKDGFVNFVGIQFDAPGDYVISVIPDSNLVETSEVTIKVMAEDDVIAQDKSRGGDKELDVKGTRPIIAQIDKPTIKLKSIEFDALEDKKDNAEVAGALGFTPFFWYAGVQIDQRYIKSLSLYYEGLVPVVSIVFIDSIGVMKKSGFPLDDSKFEIFLNSGSKNLKSIHLKFKLKNFQENKSKTYTIVGTLDLQDFYKIRFQSYTGTSFEVLQKISKELEIGFNSNITNTSDSMNWVNNGKLFRTFMSDIISHSYISDTTFLIGYVDFYYCFNYVDIEKEWNRDISTDVGINSKGLSHLNSNKDESEKVVKLQLSNDLSQNSSVFFFNKYRVNNNSTQTSLNNGHFTVSKVYDSIKKQFLVFDVDSQTSDGSKSIILKGAPADDKSIKDNYRTKYSGKMDTENVHKQYYYSETQNKVNFDNMARISVDLELPNANFNLYKFMKIQLNFVNMKPTVTNDEVSQKRLTGEWVIIDISYTWMQGNLTQKVTAVRKELSKTDEELKKDANSEPAKAEVNTQKNENPVVPGQVQPKLSTAVPPNSVYKVGQIYLVQNNSGKTFKLTITEVSENGKEVKATIKNI